MVAIRKSRDRGHFNHGWLDTYHTFSFGSYHDSRQMGFRALRVMNEDRVDPGQGFGTHGHRDMEIITYVVQGALEHRDSLGNGSIMRPGDVQRMSAGSGIRHSEFNPSPEEPVHLYQIWILPEREGLTPSYEQKTFGEEERQGRLRLVASRDAREGALTVHQDAEIFASKLVAGQQVTHPLREGRHAWLQVIRGSVNFGGQQLTAGDGAAASDEAELTIEAAEPAEILLFDLA